MSVQGWVYIGLTVLLFAVFTVIVVQVFRRDRREKMEEPKHRMLDDE